MVERVRLIELRGDSPRSQVAKDIGITPQMLGAIERGSRNPSLYLAKRIADYYNVLVDDIFFTNSRHKTLPERPGLTSKTGTAG